MTTWLLEYLNWLTLVLVLRTWTVTTVYLDHTDEFLVSWPKLCMNFFLTCLCMNFLTFVALLTKSVIIVLHDILTLWLIPFYHITILLEMHVLLISFYDFTLWHCSSWCDWHVWLPPSNLLPRLKFWVTWTRKMTFMH